ncbi:hypothetical protein BDZ88DRAFT_436690 [Geranomyces variabilis]|nr:hypothetical protein BDZ88DRAFT_436690 [Geranomyces variabilis]
MAPPPTERAHASIFAGPVEITFNFLADGFATDALESSSSDSSSLCSGLTAYICAMLKKVQWEQQEQIYHKLQQELECGVEEAFVPNRLTLKRAQQTDHLFNEIPVSLRQSVACEGGFSPYVKINCTTQITLCRVAHAASNCAYAVDYRTCISSIKIPRAKQIGNCHGIIFRIIISRSNRNCGTEGFNSSLCSQIENVGHAAKEVLRWFEIGHIFGEMAGHVGQNREQMLCFILASVVANHSFSSKNTVAKLPFSIHPRGGDPKD